MANEPSNDKKEENEGQPVGPPDPDLPQEAPEAPQFSTGRGLNRQTFDPDRTIFPGTQPRSLFHRGDVMVGVVVGGRFRIDHLIASGATGEIFSAVSLGSEQRVALKALVPALASDPTVLAAFHREISFMRSVDHPALVRYHATGHDLEIDLHWIAMELIEGPTLAEASATGAWPDRATLPILRLMLDLLATLHSRGVIHRDITPYNILLRCGDPYRPVLIDFGISSLMDAFQQRVTFPSRMFAGTLEYAAPEAFGLFGGSVGPWTDIYGLGLVIYELATGRKPFQQSNFVEAIEKRSSIPDLIGIDRRLAAILARMLAPDPKARFQRAEALRDAISQMDNPVRPAPSKLASSPPRARRRVGLISRIFRLTFGGPHGPGGSEDD